MQIYNLIAIMSQHKKGFNSVSSTDIWLKLKILAAEKYPHSVPWRVGKTSVCRMIICRFYFFLFCSSARLSGTSGVKYLGDRLSLPQLRGALKEEGKKTSAPVSVWDRVVMQRAGLIDNASAGRIHQDHFCLMHDEDSYVWRRLWPGSPWTRGPG